MAMGRSLNYFQNHIPFQRNLTAGTRGNPLESTICLTFIMKFAVGRAN